MTDEEEGEWCEQCQEFHKEGESLRNAEELEVHLHKAMFTFFNKGESIEACTSLVALAMLVENIFEIYIESEPEQAMSFAETLTGRLSLVSANAAQERAAGIAPDQTAN